MQGPKKRRSDFGRRWLAAVALAGSSAGCVTDAGPEREISGQFLYERHCGRCHGVAGVPPEGIEGVPVFADAKVLAALSDEQVAGVIRAGRPPRMPAFGEQFLEPSRRVLIAYTRSLGRSAVPPAEKLVSAKPEGGDRGASK